MSAIPESSRLNVAFIGGSLTQENAVWCPPVVDFIRECFPKKQVVYLNAAVGATDSTMGAIRIERDILSHFRPDILFVEYAVNDSGFAVENDYALRKNGVHIESIIRQARACNPEVAIVLLYFPRGFLPGSDLHKAWEQGVALKERIASHYGIKGINVLDFVMRLYEAEKQKTPTLSYEDFLLRYYKPYDMVHPTAEGYAVFRDAILDALRRDPAALLTPVADVAPYLDQYCDTIGMRYRFVSPSDERLSAEGSFCLYRAPIRFPDSAPEFIPPYTHAFPRLTDGVMQLEDGRDFKLVLSTDADAVGIYGLYSPSGMKVDVYENGRYVTSFSMMENHTRPYLELFLLSPGNGKKRTVTLVPSKENTGKVFRFGYLIEGYYKK